MQNEKNLTLNAAEAQKKILSELEKNKAEADIKVKEIKDTMDKELKAQHQ
jgi:hypothetical protein